MRLAEWWRLAVEQPIASCTEGVLNSGSPVLWLKDPNNALDNGTGAQHGDRHIGAATAQDS